MISIKLIVKSAAITVLLSHCAVAFSAVPNEMHKLSNILHIARDVICQADGSPICTWELLHRINKSDASIEFVKLVRKVSRASGALLKLTRNDNCKATTETRHRNLLNEISEVTGDSRALTGEEITFHVKVTKLLRCTAEVSNGRHPRDLQAVLPNSGNSAAKSTICWPFWRGDGFCDLGCNTEDYDYDNGDCCYESCVSKLRRYPCGYTGFQCKLKASNRPSWSDDLKLCFKWKANGDSSQCDKARHGKVCAPFGSMTKFYYDDTDERKGGCVLSWSIRAETSPSWFWTSLRLCMYSYSNGDSYQCNYGRNSRVKCRRANYWLHYVDDTDNRTGGCFIRWKLIYLGMANNKLFSIGEVYF